MRGGEGRGGEGRGERGGEIGGGGRGKHKTTKGRLHPME